MHYQHRYHAGNFADVFKHVLLVALLDALNAKAAPWAYVDTHGGAGCYDLEDAAAQRTGEAATGIRRLWAVRSPPLQQYLDLVRAVNGDGPLRRYPGSPLLALQLARAQDRILVCEQVPATANLLRTALAGDARASVHLRDGYEAVALLPPRQRRGLVLVDPPFERADEFDAITDFTMTALRRFGHGVYALWYPYKNRWQTERWLRRMRAMVDVEALDLQLDTGAPSIGQMHACGLLVLNPPFAFAAAAPGLLDALCPLLAQGSGARVASTPWPRRMTRSAIR